MKNKTALTDPSDEEVIEAMRQSNPNRIDGRTALDVLALHVGNLKSEIKCIDSELIEARRRLADAEEAKDNYRRESRAQYERTEKLSKLAVRQKDALYDAHVELENHRRHAMLCPQHFQNKGSWVRESDLKKAQDERDTARTMLSDSIGEYEAFKRERDEARSGASYWQTQADAHRSTAEELEAALLEKQKQSDAFEKAWKESLAVESKLRDVINRAWLNEKSEAPEEGFVSWTMKILEEGMAR